MSDPNETDVEVFEYEGHRFVSFVPLWAFSSRDHHYVCRVPGTDIYVRAHTRADACDGALEELRHRNL